jgi:hypothetical protein
LFALVGDLFLLLPGRAYGSLVSTHRHERP